MIHFIVFLFRSWSFDFRKDGDLYELDGNKEWWNALRIFMENTSGFPAFAVFPVFFCAGVGLSHQPWSNGRGFAGHCGAGHQGIVGVQWANRKHHQNRYDSTINVAREYQGLSCRISRGNRKCEVPVPSIPCLTGLQMTAFHRVVHVKSLKGQFYGSRSRKCRIQHVEILDRRRRPMWVVKAAHLKISKDHSNV